MSRITSWLTIAVLCVVGAGQAGCPPVPEEPTAPGPEAPAPPAGVRAGPTAPPAEVPAPPDPAPGPPGPSGVRIGPQEAWTDLLALGDLIGGARGKDWQQTPDGLAGTTPNGWAIAIPCEVQGNYELDAEFVRTRGDNEVAFVLPVGRRATSLLLSKEVGKRSGLWWAKGGETMVAPAPLANGKAHALAVTVEVKGDVARIGVRLDGAPYFDWEGPVASLTVWDPYRISNSRCVGGWGVGLRVNRLRLRMLSGEARLPAGAGVPPPSSP